MAIMTKMFAISKTFNLAHMPDNLFELFSLFFQFRGTSYRDIHRKLDR